MSTVLSMLNVTPIIHPFYETASAVSLLTLCLHDRIALRLAALSAHALAITSAVIETSVVDPEIMAWGVLNLSLNFFMLADLIRSQAGPVRCATGWDLLLRVETLIVGRLRAWALTKTGIWTADRQFF